MYMQHATMNLSWYACMGTRMFLLFNLIMILKMLNLTIAVTRCMLLFFAGTAATMHWVDNYDGTVGGERYRELLW